MQAIIIEDEKAASKLLSAILKDYHPEIDMVGIAPSIVEAQTLLQDVVADVIFLDIELQDGRCFELIPLIDISRTKIIFTTAYDQYAIQAFDYEAVDYILKPYGPKEVTRAVSRAKELIDSKQTIDRLYDTIQRRKTTKSRVALPTQTGITYVETNTIIRCEADDNYTNIILKCGKRLVVTKTLGTIEEIIGNDRFLRSHKTHLVNLDHVLEVGHEENKQVLLSNGEQIPLSRRKRSDFIAAL